MTFRLEMLGGLALVGPAGPVTGRAAQRLRLAILALLATARDGAMSRDKLAAYLWPEADGGRARQNLSVAIHAIRGALGEESLVAAGDVLRLGRERVGSDVADFEAAVERGDLQRAAALYRGPFLDGIHVASAPLELEEWIAAERERLRHCCAGVLERLAGERDARGDDRGAVEAWRRLVSLEPLSARGAVGLMRALARSGDRAGALLHALAHEALLRAELGTTPEPAVAAMVARLRAEAAAPLASWLGADGPAGIYAELLRRAFDGRYEIERELAHGGTAAQYLARASGSGRPVVLHVFEPAVAAGADAAVLVRELERARALDHPHLLPMLDACESRGVIYYAVPVVPGGTLRDRLKRERRLPVAEAVRIAREVAGALAHAHERGVVHRDVKPKHILLDLGPDGPALLANAGVASAVLAAAGEQTTHSGFVVGTPAYMSPEQMAGEPRLDGRSDIYSLACVLYEMLAGEPPLAARSPQAADPGIRARRESVPEALDRVLARALARSAADRFRTAAEFRDALTAQARKD